MKPIAVLLGIVLMLAMGACSNGDDPTAEAEDRIQRVRNSEFTGDRLRVFLTPRDGTELSVNSADDAVEGSPRDVATPIPGHRARDWTFVKETDEGTSVAYALVSWDEDDPADYLMAGWWAEFHGQTPPELSFENASTWGIVDGPEIDPGNPPELPIAGKARYAGQAGGLYRYELGSGWGEHAGAEVLDEYEGTITITADFATGMLSGCIGCTGDLVTRRAHFDVFLGAEILDVRELAAGYELRMESVPFGSDGFFESTDVEVRHPDRTITDSGGFWGGLFSNVPDADGNPRLVAGFSSAGFQEDDGSLGRFVGAFVGLSERFKGSGE